MTKIGCFLLQLDRAPHTRSGPRRRIPCGGTPSPVKPAAAAAAATRRRRARRGMGRAHQFGLAADRVRELHLAALDLELREVQAVLHDRAALQPVHLRMRTRTRSANDLGSRASDRSSDRSAWDHAAAMGAIAHGMASCTALRMAAESLAELVPCRAIWKRTGRGPARRTSATTALGSIRVEGVA